METNKYQNGKIYTIRHPETDKFYIGSSTQSLSKRLAKHKGNYKCNPLDKKLPTSKLLFELGVDDCYIELLENYPCNNKEELNKREGELMRLHKDNIINRCLAGRTKKEYDKIYNEENKEKKKEQKKEYYEANKEKAKQLYTCVCGATIQHQAKPKHNKSKKHLEFMEI
tara:strand:- start:2606 stop:3112 length:507 start_codon:yes stop_codon:yes gene_type:complete